jgi:multicomponent Na+:H+ antiporter subunit D
MQARVGVAGAVALFVAIAVLFQDVATGQRHVLHLGGWQAPLGITLVVDTLAALMLLTTAVLHLTISIYSLASIGIREQRYGYFTFVNVLVMGVCGAFMTGDLFNLYVWFEVMLIASFVLLVLGGGRPQMEAGIKYVTLSLLSSALFLAAVGITYGVANTLNMADLAIRLAIATEQRPWLTTATAVLLLLAFGIKAAVFPLYFWLPASYHTAAPAVSALFAGLLTKVGVYALLRVFTVAFPASDYVYGILLVAGGLTMLIGVLGAVAQKNVRRILSIHIISQIGYMIMGLGLLIHPDPEVQALAVAAAVFYIIHNMIVKTNLFLIAGIMRRQLGTEYLPKMGGLMTQTPWLAALFLISALALAGIPPLSGFWAKLTIIQAGFSAGQYLVTGVAIFVGLLTLISMLKIWTEAFWKPRPADATAGGPAANPHPVPARKTMMLPVVALVAITIGIGLFPQSLLTLCRRAADEVLNRDAYITAVGLAQTPAPPGEPESEQTP